MLPVLSRVQRALTEVGQRKSEMSLDLFCVIFAFVISNTISTLANALLGLMLGESISFPSFAVGLIGGLVPITVGSIFWRASNLAANNPGINALAYAIPVLSLVWLFLLSQAAVSRWDYLVIGVLGILTANLLINFDAGIRSRFRALLA